MPSAPQRSTIEEPPDTNPETDIKHLLIYLKTFKNTQPTPKKIFSLFFLFFLHKNRKNKKKDFN
jgi:hypothetical protein